jgi:hypothetical protein
MFEIGHLSVLCPGYHSSPRFDNNALSEDKEMSVSELAMSTQTFYLLSLGAACSFAVVFP